MTGVRISLPAEATLVAAVLSAVARALPGPVEVYASRDGAELAVETAVSTPSAGGVDTAEVEPPAAIPPGSGVSPAAPSEPSARLEVSTTVPTVEAGAGDHLDPPAQRRCETCGDPLPVQTGPGRPRWFCPSCKPDRKAAADRDSIRRRRAATTTTPTAATEPSPQVTPPAGDRPTNPLAPLTTWACEHCGYVAPDKKALGKHRATVHPVSRTTPRYDPQGDPVHVVRSVGGRPVVIA